MCEIKRSSSQGNDGNRDHAEKRKKNSKYITSNGGVHGLIHREEYGQKDMRICRSVVT